MLAYYGHVWTSVDLGLERYDAQDPKCKRCLPRRRPAKSSRRMNSSDTQWHIRDKALAKLLQREESSSNNFGQGSDQMWSNVIKCDQMWSVYYAKFWIQPAYNLSSCFPKTVWHLNLGFVYWHTRNHRVQIQANAPNTGYMYI